MEAGLGSDCRIIFPLFWVSLLSSRTGGSTGQTGRPSQSSVLTSTQAGTRRRCWRMWKDSWISLWFPLSGRQVRSWVLSLLSYHRWGWWSPHGLFMTKTIRATAELFGSHFKLLDLFSPMWLYPSCSSVPGNEVALDFLLF